jgi:hypothetical protein
MSNDNINNDKDDDNNNNNNLLQEDAKLTRQPSVVSLYSSMRAKLYHPPKEDFSSMER